MKSNRTIKPEDLDALAEEADEITDPAARSVLQKALSLVGIDLSKAAKEADEDDEEDEDEDEDDEELDGDDDSDDDVDSDDDEDDEDEDGEGELDGMKSKGKVAKSLLDESDDDFEMSVEDDSESEYDEATPVLKAIADYMDAMNEKVESQEALLKSLVEQNAEAATRFAKVTRRLNDIAKSLDTSNDLNKSLVGELESRRRAPAGTPRNMASHDDEGVLQKGLAGYEELEKATEMPFGMNDDVLVKGLHSLLMSEAGEGSGISLETITRLPKTAPEKRPDSWYQAAAGALGIQLPEKR